jgi:hypothetical protein
VILNGRIGKIRIMHWMSLVLGQLVRMYISEDTVITICLSIQSLILKIPSLKRFSVRLGDIERSDLKNSNYALDVASIRTAS